MEALDSEEGMDNLASFLSFHSSLFASFFFFFFFLARKHITDRFNSALYSCFILFPSSTCPSCHCLLMSSYSCQLTHYTVELNCNVHFKSLAHCRLLFSCQQHFFAPNRTKKLLCYSCVNHVLPFERPSL